MKLKFFCSALCLFQLNVAAEQTQPIPKPCSAEIYKQFDFWVGEWNVYDVKDNSLQGVDIITKDLSGCRILQNWHQQSDRYKSLGSDVRLVGHADSFVSNGKWRQTWIDNQSFSFRIEGEFKNNKMDLLGVVTGENWSIPYRIVWQKNIDGTISNWGEQQLANATIDGKPAKFAEVPSGTWVKQFDLIYKKRKK